MKTRFPHTHFIFVFIITIAALLVAPAPNKAMAYEYVLPSGQSSIFASGLQDGGRLIIRRYPAFGSSIIVALKIDGAPVSGLAYGHTYEAFLTPGRHVLSVLAAPMPPFHTPWETTVNIRAGETYYFTAKNGSSQVVLERMLP